MNITFNKDQLAPFLFPYKQDCILVDSCVLTVDNSQKYSLQATANFPSDRPSYLSKKIKYLTAREGNDLAVQSTVLFFVILLMENIIDLKNIDIAEETRKDPEVFITKFSMNCRKNINRKSSSIIRCELEDNWSVRKINNRESFIGKINFFIGEEEKYLWDGKINVFFFLDKQ